MLAETGRASLTSAQLGACKTIVDDLLFKKSQILTWVTHSHEEEGGTRTHLTYPVQAAQISALAGVQKLLLHK